MRILMVAGVLALAGCQGGDGGEGTSFSITGNSVDGNAQGASVDGGTGAVKIDLPFLSGNFTLPRMQLDAGDFDLNGVRLYPGSTIKGVSVDAGRAASEGAVKIAFESPATAMAVQQYFLARLPKAGFTLKASGNRLSGTTDEDQPFSLSVDEAGPTRSTGTITIG